MGVAARLPSRLFARPFLLFALLIFIFFLILGMLYRAFSQVDLVIDPVDDPAGTALLVERLERLDADYRIRDDGTVLIDGGDAARLMQAGLLLTAVRMEHHRTAQAVLLLFLLGTGSLLALLWRRLASAAATATGTSELSAAQGHGRDAETPGAAEEDATPPVPALFTGEHPQAVAVCLLAMEAEQAAAALETMEASQRARVWERMARSGACDTVLRARVADLFARKQARLERLGRSAEATEKIRAVFRRLSPETKRVLLATLRRYPEARLVTLLEAECLPSPQDKEA